MQQTVDVTPEMLRRRLEKEAIRRHRTRHAIGRIGGMTERRVGNVLRGVSPMLMDDYLAICKGLDLDPVAFMARVRIDYEKSEREADGNAVHQEHQ